MASNDKNIPYDIIIILYDIIITLYDVINTLCLSGELTGVGSGVGVSHLC